MPKFSQQALLTYAQNRDRPDALLTLAASVTPEEAAAAPKKITLAPHSRSPKQKGSGKPGNIFELFYRADSWKNGSKIATVPDHYDHVHVAADTRRAVYLGRLAQKMGLHVGENKYFTGTTPTGGHAPNSWHYQNKAIDVSGDPRKMAAFEQLVRRQYRLR